MRGRHADRSALRTRSTRNGPDRRLIGAAVAAVISLLLFTNGLGTWSFWQDQVIISGTQITSGSLTMIDKFEVQLLSRQVPGKRTYASTSTETCAPPPLGGECRVVTSSLADERLIPGDTLRIIRSVKVGGQGANLKGDLTFNAASLLDQTAGASNFARSATVTLAVTKPNASVVTVAGPAPAPLAIPVGRDQVNPFGTYTAVVTITTPANGPEMPGNRWNTALQGQILNLGALTATFTQTP